MRRPSCTLCLRVGTDCVFPTKRKRPDRFRTVDHEVRPRSIEGCVDTISMKTTGSSRSRAGTNCRPTVWVSREQLEVDDSNTIRSTVVSSATAERSMGGNAFANAAAGPRLWEQALQRTSPEAGARVGERAVDVEFNNPDATMHVGEVLGSQYSFSPSLSEILLEDAVADQHFWGSSDRLSTPVLQATELSYSQNIDQPTALLEAGSLVPATSLAPGGTSLSEGLESTSYGLPVPLALTKELSVPVLLLLISTDTI